MKHLICLILSALLILSATACSASSTSTEPAAEATETNTPQELPNGETPPELPNGETPPDRPDGMGTPPDGMGTPPIPILPRSRATRRTSFPTASYCMSTVSH